MNPPIHLATNQPIHPSTYLSTNSSFHVSIHPPTNMSIHLSIYPLIHSPTNSSIYASIHPSIYPPSYQPTNPSILLATSPCTHQTHTFTTSFVWHVVIEDLSYTCTLPCATVSLNQLCGSPMQDESPGDRCEACTEGVEMGSRKWTLHSWTTAVGTFGKGCNVFGKGWGYSLWLKHSVFLWISQASMSGIKSMKAGQSSKLKQHGRWRLHSRK